MKTQRGLIIALTALALSVLVPCNTSSAGSNSSGSIPGSLPQVKAIASSLTATTVDSTVTLVVRVKDEDDKLVPIAHVNVYQEHRNFSGLIVRPPDYQQDTNANGIATIQIVVKTGEALKLSIEVSREDMQTERDDVDYGTEFPARILKQFELKHRAKDAEGLDTMTVKIHVVRKDADGDKALDGAKVDVWLRTFPNRKNYSSQTDANGDASVVTLLFNELEVRASKDRFGEKSQGYNSKEYKKEIGPITITLERQTGVEVTINVTDQDTRNGVGDANVVLDGVTNGGYHTATTDMSGNARLFVPEKDTFTVRISQEYYESLSGGEVRLEGEETKAAAFSLKAKAKKASGQSSIAVTVLQGDKVERIARYNLPLPDASVTVGGTTLGTDSSGRAKVSGDFEGNVEVVVAASGYKRQSKTVRFSGGARLTGVDASVTFLMQPETSEAFIEVTVLAIGKNGKESEPLAGATVTAGGETTTTNATGRARLTGDFGGSVEVSVEKSGYLRQAKSVNASGERGSAAFTLQLEPDEDSVSITVMAQDPKGGRATPIFGAQVSANGLTATTDKGGRATISGGFKDSVEVGAQANGFVSQVQQVSISKPARTGSANFVLLPEPPPPPPLSLIVEVLDSAAPNKPLESALVKVLLPVKPVGGASPEEKTDSLGEARFNLKGSAEDLAKYRSGLRLQVGKTNYSQRLTDITADLLLPSTEARRITVFLERDWADLRTAVEALEKRVLAWNNDVALADNAASLVKIQAEQVPKAKERVTAIIKEIEFAGRAFTGANGVSTATLRCKEAARLKSNIQSYQRDANAKEHALETFLDTASTLAANCSSSKDGDALLAMHKSALQQTATIAALEKKALMDNSDLNTLASDKNDVQKIIEAVEKKIAEIGQEVSKAEEGVTKVGTDFTRADWLMRNLAARQVILTGELQTLRSAHGLDKSVAGLPAGLNGRLSLMGQLLGKQRAFAVPKAEWQTVQELPTLLRGAKTFAEKSLAQYKGGPSGACEIETMDDVVQDIGSANVSATIELAAAGLSTKAQACISKGKCQPLISDVRFLLEQGAIDPAAAKINQARAQGCDVTGLEEELDYWKTVRDAVVYLKVLMQDCRFRDAIEWSLNLPARVRNRPLMMETLTQVYAGSKASDQVWNLRDQAKAAVAQSNNTSSAEPFIQQAEKIAAPFPCLVKEAATFRSDYQSPNVNRNPNATGVLGAPVAKPEVEKLPNDVEQAINILSKTTKKDKARPEVEEIPKETEKVPNKPKTTDGSTEPGIPKGVRPCTANEQTAFAKMSGSWKGWRTHVTITGSCEQATGTYLTIEYCEGVDAPYNQNLAKHPGTFKGRMEFGSLQLNYETPAAGGHEKRTGTGSCEVNADGTLSCSGVGCGDSVKKQ